MTKKILAITGIRSEYDLIKPVLDLLKIDKKIDLSLVVSGCHLSKFHNYSYKLILKDGFKIQKKIKSFNEKFKDAERSQAVGILVKELTKFIKKDRPDFILTVGDREEAIAASIVGNYNKILVVHIGGGDKAYGNTDDPIRFATSKLSHIHCVFSKINYKNLLNFGEESFRIFQTGNPSYTNIANQKIQNLKEISKKLGINLKKKNFIIFIQHPISSQYHLIEKHYLNSLKAISKYALIEKMIVLSIKPNTDPGSEKIIKLIDKHKTKYKNVIFCNNLESNIFVNLLRNAYCVAGNSSMGLLESSFYNLPAINIGNRQKGRDSPGNVIFVKNNLDSILKGFNDIKLLRKKYKKFKANFYGDLKSAQNILDVIKLINTKDIKWYNKKKLCL